MANDQSVEILLRARDEATATIKKVGDSLTAMGADAKNSYSQVSSATSGAGKESSKYTQLIREERTESRMRNFAIRESAGAVTQLSETFVGSNGLTGNLQKGLSSLFETDFAFKGLAAAGSGLQGTLGKVASAVGSIAMPAAIAIGAFALIKSTVDDDNKKLSDATESIIKLKKELGLIPSDTFDEISKKIDEIKTKGPEVSTWSATWRAILDGIVGTHTQIAYLTGAVSENVQKTLEEEVAEQKEIQKIGALWMQIGAQDAQNSIAQIERSNRTATEKIRDEERVKLAQNQREMEDKLRVAASELEKFSIRELYESKATGIEEEYQSKRESYDKQTSEKIAADRQALADRIREINAGALAAWLNVDKTQREAETDSATYRIALETEYAVKALQIERDQKAKKISDLGEQYALQQEYDAKIQEVIIDGTSKSLEKEKELHQSAMSAMEQVSIFLTEDGNAKEYASIVKWEHDAAEKVKADKTLSAVELQNALDKINQAGAERRAAVELAEEKKVYARISGAFRSAVGVLSQLSSQNTQANIDNIETERDAKLAAIDSELAATNISEEEKNKLEAERASVVAEYDAKEREAKKSAWEADKAAKIAMAIIDTASAVVEALPNIPLSIAAGVIGAAQIAVIASQPVPKFHQGGSMYFDAPPSQEMPILIRGGETVRVNTPEQESRGGSRQTVVNVIFNSPVPHAQWVTGSIKKALRETGLTVDKLLINNRSNVVLG